MDQARVFFSLRWKILAWFFVNLLVLGAVLFMPHGIVGLLIRRRWLPVGRTLFRRLANSARLRHV